MNDIGTIKEENISMEERILSLGETPISQIAKVLGVHTITIAAFLRKVGVSRYEEDFKKGRRVIILTKNGVQELLEYIHQSQQPKVTTREKIQIILDIPA